MHSSSGGIGYHTAYQLALKGAKVYVGARDSTKATNAIKEMKASSKGDKALDLVPLAVDLGDFKQIVKVAKEFLASEKRLDILVNNAAACVESTSF